MQTELRVGAAGLPAEGAVATVWVGDAEVALVRSNGRLHAVDAVCPHAGGPLGEGFVDGASVVCPYHGWAFDLATGRCGVAPRFSLEVWQIDEDADGAWVRRRAVACSPEVR